MKVKIIDSNHAIPINTIVEVIEEFKFEYHVTWANPKDKYIFVVLKEDCEIIGNGY